MQQTEKYKFKKRELTDKADITQAEDNWDVLDAELEAIDTRMGDVEGDVINIGPRVTALEDEVGSARDTEDTLGDRLDAADEAVSAHLDNKSNPHEVEADQVPYDNAESNLSATDTQGAIDEVAADLTSHKEDYATHLETEMPHQFKDLKNNKTYKFGFQLSDEGNPQLIYEEVA